MPRPTSKSDLISTANANFEKMLKLTDAITGGAQNAVFNFGEDEKRKEAHWKRDKNMRDVFIHLYEWHTLLLNWVNSNKNGSGKPFLPEPYNWKNYGEMNVKFWEKHRETPYEKAKEMLITSRKEVMALIEGFSNEELFERRHFNWTGTSNLGSYCISATASHYDWAMKKIKAYKTS